MSQQHTLFVVCVSILFNYKRRLRRKMSRFLYFILNIKHRIDQSIK